MRKILGPTYFEGDDKEGDGSDDNLDDEAHVEDDIPGDDDGFGFEDDILDGDDDCDSIVGDGDPPGQELLMKIAIQRLQEDADMVRIPLSESDCLVYTCLEHEGNTLLMGRQKIDGKYVRLHQTPGFAAIGLPERPGVSLRQREQYEGVERWRAYFPGAGNKTFSGPDSYLRARGWLMEKEAALLAHEIADLAGQA